MPPADRKWLAWYSTVVMATKTPKKAAVRTGIRKGRTADAGQAESEVPPFPIEVVENLLALAIGMIIYILVNKKVFRGAGNRSRYPFVRLSLSNIPRVHYHVGSTIGSQGTVHPIPSNIGITRRSSAPSCY